MVWACLLPLVVCAGEPVRVTVVTDAEPGPAVHHGLAELEKAVRAKGAEFERATSLDSVKGSHVIVAGLADAAGPADAMHAAAGIQKPAGTETLVVRRAKWGERPILLVSGADDRGLMYALLDVADRIGWSRDPKDLLIEVHDAAERPYVLDRAVSKYTMHQGVFEICFYDEAYWARYFDILARNRFNSFVLIFGYENAGYFAPPYPQLFDVEEFPDIYAVGVTKERQERNLRTLNRIIAMAHERGLDFTVAIWDHIYRGGVQGPTERVEKPTPGVAWGLTAENLLAYTRAALGKFLRDVPGIDAIQFRMHNESGLKNEEMTAFWEAVFGVVNEHRPGIRFDARAKELPDAVIDKGLEMGVNLRVCTKYWMEQMGMPFHPTHIHPDNQFDRRHQYADLLRYPQWYKMHWRLWNGGTTRILLWGDPEYVRRFAGSTHLYGGEGFEVNEPLATKLQDHPHQQPPFELLAPQYRYYDWEFERYWYFFQVFGRAAYNPDTPPEVWSREFERRFGKAGSSLERALHRASWILPRIVSYSYPYNRFPTTRGWAERQRMEDLPKYAEALPSDTEQFQSLDEAARFRIEGLDSAKVHPEASARWFERAARDVLALVAEAEEQAGWDRSREFVSTVTDLRILARLAEYHSHRVRAGFAYALFKHSRDLNVLDDALWHEEEAVGAWERLVKDAGDVYTDNLAMGRASEGMAGHWRDELVPLRRGIKALRRQRRELAASLGQAEPSMAHVPVRRMRPREPLAVRATVYGPEPIETRLAVADKTGAWRRVPMEYTEPGLYRARVDAQEVSDGVAYFIEAVGSTGTVTTWPARGANAPVRPIITDDEKPPVVVHEPVANGSPGRPLTVTADVRDPSGVAWVRLRYRPVNQHFDFQTLDLAPAGQEERYEVTVPGDHVPTDWDFMYLIEVMDTKGNGAIYPNLECETPYVVVPLHGNRP